MEEQKKQGFTLVELIVVISILAIIGTIAFTTLQGYSREARNSSRTSDIATIRSALSFYSTVNSLYPVPDNYDEISHSGVVLWRQGTFGDDVRSKLGKIGKTIIDPTLKTEFDYGVLATRGDYQVATSYELAYSPTFPGVNGAYALDNTQFINYIEGTYDSYDINAQVGDVCSLVTVPSLLLSEIPPGGELFLGDSYYFSYDRGTNLAKNSYDSVNIVALGPSFELQEVYDKCTIDVISEIDLYIAKLSTAYQQYSDSEVYENIVFTSDTQSFRKSVLNLLDENRVEVSSNLVDLLNSPVPDNVFSDIFSGADSTNIVSHSSGSGIWLIEAGLPDSYQIQNNSLEKINSSTSTFYVDPSPSISSSGSTVTFDVLSFGGGSIYSYLRYEDDNNHYGVEINNAGYRLFRKLAGVETNIQDISEAIIFPTQVSFSAKGDNLILEIGNIEKENTIVGGIDSVGKPLMYLENAGAIIDNYTLTYK